MNDNPGIFSELEQLEEERKKAQAREKRLNNALAAVIESKEGRRVLRWILELTQHQGSVTSHDPMVMMQLSAQRDVGLRLLSRLTSVNPHCLQLLEIDE